MGCCPRLRIKRLGAAPPQRRRETLLTSSENGRLSISVNPTHAEGSALASLSASLSLRSWRPINMAVVNRSPPMNTVVAWLYAAVSKREVHSRRSEVH